MKKKSLASWILIKKEVKYKEELAKQKTLEMEENKYLNSVKKFRDPFVNETKKLYGDLCRKIVVRNPLRLYVNMFR